MDNKIMEELRRVRTRLRHVEKLLDFAEEGLMDCSLAWTEACDEVIRARERVGNAIAALWRIMNDPPEGPEGAQ